MVGYRPERPLPLRPMKLQKQHDDRGGGGGGESSSFKHIILGVDGTWQAAYSDMFHSNVYRLNVALNYQDNSSDKNPQIFIYSSGLGTANASARIPAGAFGEGLDESILQAYINLVSNYVPGDKIYLFGFSRGAVAVRALTGFITYAGLLKATFSSLIEHAWRYFTGMEAKIDYPSQRDATTHPNVQIEFLGVWDTVPGPHKRDRLLDRCRFSSLKLDPSVNHGVHIVSIDDSRKDFSPLLWNGRSTMQTLEQIWMPGVHGDIGGGYNDAFLSSVSLLAMIDKLREYYPSLSFDENYIDGSVFRIIEKEDIVISDEWKHYAGRLFKGRDEYQRCVSDVLTSSHSAHPLTNFMDQKEVTIRGIRGRYRPSYRVTEGAGTLTTTTFPPLSWYARKLEELFRARFGMAVV